jgi:hypothetical protein
MGGRDQSECLVAINRNSWSRSPGARTLEAACSRDAVIRDIADGQVEGVARVFAFNPAEHVADDVTEEIAIALARRCPPGEPITPAVRDFIEANAGLAYARGLAVEDRTFAAA